jgi:type II secretory pathway component PulK
MVRRLLNWLLRRPDRARGLSEPQAGVAMLIVLLAVVFLAASVAEFSFNTRVNLRMTGNVQKEVKAYFNARSGIMVSLFALQAKEIVDKIVGMYASFLGGGGGTAIADQIEIWRAIEPLCNSFSSGKLSMLGVDLLDLEGVEGIGLAKGDSFGCKVELEDGKVNLNRVGTYQDKQTLNLELRGLFMQHIHGQLFDEDERLIDELIGNIIDWADPDTTQSQFQEGALVEAAAGGGEKDPYGEFDYKIKNAKYDSIEELRLVDKVTDGVYCLLRDRITVYNTEKLNVNSADLETVKGLVCAHMLDGGRLVCNPQLRAAGVPTPIDVVGGYFQICRDIKNNLFTPPFTSPAAVVKFFQKLAVFTGETLPLDTAALQAKVGVKGKVWRISAEGKSGNVTKTITTVVDTSTGRLVYWRE